MASSYDSRIQSQFFWNKIKQQELRAVLGALGAVGGMSFLDLGSGTGYYASVLKARGADVVCVDQSASMHQVLLDKNHNAILCSIECLRLNRSFDRVLALGVLEFIDDWTRAMQTVCHHLRPSGLFIVLMPKSNWIGWVYKKIHEAWGCSTYIRPDSHFIEVARSAELELLDLKKGLISDVYVFKKL